MSSIDRNEILHFSCPCCGKKYSSRRDRIKSEVPEYKCNRCESHFSVSQDREGGTWRSKLIQSGPKARVCGKCGAMNTVGREDCRVCGVVFSKYHEGDWSMLQGNKGLEIQWRTVLTDYENIEMHVDFVDLCRKNENLAFAMQKYQGLLDLIPGDDIAIAMKAKIKSIATLPVSEPVLKPKKRRALRWLPLIIFVPALLGVVLFMFGLKSYEFRNLAGLGASLSVLSLGLLMLFRK